MVSTTGVTGWFRAKPCSQPGIVPIGTKVLLGYGRNMTRKVKPLAASADLASSPAVAASQEIASTNSSRMPAAATQPAALACGRKPIRNATPKTRMVEAVFRTMLAAT